jgi:hypothetical protein
MQPNPWDDGEYSSSDVSMEDSAVAGDTDSTKSVHLHSPETQSNFPQAARPSSILVGSPQQVHMPMGQQVVYLQQQSSSSKVIGILLILLGAFSSLGFLNLLMPIDPVTNEQIPISALASMTMNTLLTAVGYILAGVWMTQYKKKGIHLALLVTFLSYIFGVASVALGGPDGGLELFFGEDAVLGITAVLNGICSGICALIIAIPLLSGGNQGLDDSRFF